MKNWNFILIAWIIVLVLLVFEALALFVVGIVLCCFSESAVYITISIFGPIGCGILWIFANCILQMMENIETTAENTSYTNKILHQVVKIDQELLVIQKKQKDK